MSSRHCLLPDRYVLRFFGKFFDNVNPTDLVVGTVPIYIGTKINYEEA